MKMPKKITIEELAQMVAKGFQRIESRMATKDDLKNLATKAEVEDINLKLDNFL